MNSRRLVLDLFKRKREVKKDYGGSIRVHESFKVKKKIGRSPTYEIPEDKGIVEF